MPPGSAIEMEETMMKSKGFAALAACALAFFALSGCVSLSNAGVIRLMSKVALVSVTSNADVEWAGDDEKSGGLGKGLLNIASNKSKATDEKVAAVLSRADVLVDEAESVLYKGLANAPSIQFIPKHVLFKSAAYSNAREIVGANMTMLKPEGYRFIPAGAKELPAALETELGAKGTLYAALDFSKAMKTGLGRSGVMVARVSMTVSCIDPKGKTVFWKNYRAASDDTIPVVVGVYDPFKLNDLMKEAIKKACSSFIADLK
jgi:hypothetical protein